MASHLNFSYVATQFQTRLYFWVIHGSRLFGVHCFPKTCFRCLKGFTKNFVNKTRWTIMSSVIWLVYFVWHPTSCWILYWEGSLLMSPTFRNWCRELQSNWLPVCYVTPYREELLLRTALSPPLGNFETTRRVFYQIWCDIFKTACKINRSFAETYIRILFNRTTRHLN